MSQLPIHAIHNDFLTQLARSHVVIEAATGSGKSTCLPVWASVQGRVLVVQPRRVACTALAEFIAREQGWSLGKEVGYAIRLHTCFTPDTQVVFVTPGVALRWLSENELGDFSVVMLDEFHERRWDTDLLLALLKKRTRNKLIVTSATLNGQQVANYIDAERLVAQGKCFEVEVSYVASDSRHMPDIRGLEDKVAQAVESGLQATDGDLLAFLPGRRELNLCAGKLRRDDIEVIQLSAASSPQEQHKALNLGDKRRVILATNVAETSLTIPGVTCVIDSGLERRTHQRNGRTVLGLHAISFASAEQRKGRAGRLAPGVCFRLWGKAAPISALTPPEMQREELTDAMLASACSGELLDNLVFLTPLPQRSVLQAKEKLRLMRAIDEEGKVTPHGERLYPLPLDTLFCHLITLVDGAENQAAMVDLAAALSMPQRLWKMPQSPDGKEILKSWCPYACDFMTLIYLIRTQVPEGIEVDPSLLAEARKLAGQVRALLELPPLSHHIDFDRDACLLSVCRVLPELAFVRRLTRKNALGNGYIEVTQGRDTRFDEESEACLVFDIHSLPGRGVKQNLNLATCMAPVSLSTLADAGLGQWQQEQTQMHEGESLTQEVLIYANREIARRTLTPSGDAACIALAELILKGDVMPGLGAQIKQDIAAWALWLALGKGEGDSPDAQEWLSQRLKAYGVEGMEDIQLLDEADLGFDEGIPHWQRQEFDEVFPREVNLAGLKMCVHYFSAKKLVVVEKVSGSRKEDPKRWELPRWSGWRIQYKKASRVIDIR